VDIRAAIFDMDGLMLDTEPSYRKAWQKAAAECGYDLSDEAYTPLIGQRTADAETLLRTYFGEKFPLDVFRVACQKFEELAFSNGPFPKKPGLLELLALLDSWNIPKAVATSTKRRRAVPQLTAAALLDRFDVVVTGDEVANGKPAPDIFLLAAARLSVENSNCLVFEDSEAGVLAAHRAGMPVYLVPDLNPPSPEAKQAATATFDSLSAVARHLETGAVKSGTLTV
jgi:HAD superfamily hydrolase (TIGR01509 family)